MMMMKQLLLVLAATLTLVHAAPTSPSSTAVIVKLKPGGAATPRKVSAFLADYSRGRPVLMDQRGGGGNHIKYEYDPRVFNGVAGSFTPDFLAQLQLQFGVEYVEPDGRMYALGSQEKPPSWGLTRISQHQSDPAQPYVYANQAGEGVEAWVIDTGIDAKHPDFEGRAQMSASFVPNEDPNTDMNGHGTHVAGTIGSAKYGVAKKVRLFGVKVLNGSGSGTYSDVIAGINHVATKATKGRAVANMSLGGGKSRAVDDAIDAVVAAGVVMVVAAGNSATDACQSSPSGAANAFAVGSVDRNDAQSSFSNRGKCVKLYAPGRDITSTWIGGNGATKTISGTSMASPHVAGVAALYMSVKAYASPAAVYSELLSAATKGVVAGLDTASPNLLVFNSAAAPSATGSGSEEIAKPSSTASVAA
jgi:subtilisin family serine protease